MYAKGKRPEVQGQPAACPIASCPHCEKLKMEAEKRPEVRAGDERPEGDAEEKRSEVGGDERPEGDAGEKSGLERRRRRQKKAAPAWMQGSMAMAVAEEIPEPQGAVSKEGFEPQGAVAEEGSEPKGAVSKEGFKPQGAVAEEGSEPKGAVAEEIPEPQEVVAEEKDKLEFSFDPNADPNAYAAILHRKFWDSTFARLYGSYETKTSILPVRFTDGLCDSASPLETLQIFSVKVIGVDKGVSWPLHVYGKVAARDTVDRHRNMIFDRERDNCQIIHEDSPYLALTGPSRAVVLSVHHSFIEVELKIKRDSDDEEFSYLSAAYIEIVPSCSFIMQRDLTSRLSTLQLTVGYIIKSVEATIIVKVSSGKWPYGYGGLFNASTASIYDRVVLLLGFVDDILPVEDDGQVSLSRCVVSVETKGKLEISMEAIPVSDEDEGDDIIDVIYFTPKRAGRSKQKIKIGSCEMEVTVVWSLLMSYR